MRINTFRYIVVASVALVALLVLAGWLFDVTLLRRPLSGVSMNPLTAVLFLFLCLALLLVTSAPPKKNIASVLAIAAAAGGLVKILDLLSITRIKADVFLFPARVNADLVNDLPNRMAPNTAACMVLSGLAIFFAGRSATAAKKISQVLALLTAVTGLLSVLGYAYKVETFYGIESFIPMAAHTAISFLLIASSTLFLHSRMGSMQSITSRFAGGIMARGLLPAAILIPILFGYLQLRWEKAGYFSTAFGTALLVVSIITILVVIIRYNAGQLNRRDAAKEEAERRLAELNTVLERKVEERTADALKSQAIYKTLAKSIPGSAIVIIDSQGRYVLAEGDLLEKLGYDKTAMVGAFYKDVLKERTNLINEQYHRMLEGEVQSQTMNIRGLELFTQFVPLQNDEGRTRLGMVISLDISEIRKAHAKIDEMNRDLEKKIVERTEQLDTVNKELESFSYSVSHDLRAPLRAIDGYARMLEEDFGKELDKEALRLLTVIRYNATRMGKLIDDLLAFSRLGKKEIARTELDMNELVAGVVSELQRDHPSKATINIGTLHKMKGDYSLISQVMTNLISNAIKYSSKKENPMVDIFSEKRDGRIFYHVQDNGAGFSMKYSDKLFGVFQRLHRPDEFEGTGVGLAMVQRIISKHGGTVGAQGEEGKGATFSFNIPETDAI